MKTIARIDEFKRLWSMVIGSLSINGHFSKPCTQYIPCPPDEQVWRWMRFEDNVIEHGLGRLRTKVLRGEINTQDAAGRYLTAVLCAEEKRRIGLNEHAANREKLQAEMSGGVR